MGNRFFFSSRSRHTGLTCDWSSDVCSSDLGLARIVGHVAEQCGSAEEERLATALAGDELVSHLLMLHGLHPDDVKRRVEGALERVRPYLRSEERRVGKGCRCCGWAEPYNV